MRSLLILLIATSAVVVLPSTSADADAARRSPGKLPIASLGAPPSGAPGAAIAIRVRASARKGRRLAGFKLSFGDGSRSRRGRSLPTKPVIHRYRRAGTYRLSLVVVDNRGARRVAKRRVRIVPPPAGMPGRPAAPQPFGPTISSPPTPTDSTPARTDPTPAAPTPDRSPLSLAAPAIPLVVGSQAGIEQPPPLQGIAVVDAVVGLPDGVSWSRRDDALVLSAASDAAPSGKLHAVTVTGKGCTVAGGCEHPLTLTVPLSVRALEAPPGDLDDFTAAGPDRVAAAEAQPVGGKLLQDELVVTVGTPDSPGTRDQADAAAQAVSGIVSGGIEALGMYEIRWTSPQDLAVRRTQLLAQFNVTNVSMSAVDIFDTATVEPSDWSDDGPPVKWPFRVTRTTSAWEATQGTSTVVGIVDGGQAFGHEDLNIKKRIGSNGIDDHATHVAGTACAKQNGIGLVGFAWGCPIITSGWSDNSIKGVVKAMTDVANAGAQVINMSLGWGFDEGCAPSQAAQDELVEHVRQWRNDFRTLMRGDVGRGVVWTLSAGNNCAAGVASPFGLNADLGNVITVAATNSDGKLANFSAFGQGVEVAAPGGVGVSADAGGPAGIWSTTVSSCWVVFRCSTYGVKVGTSMAAPAVAGIAALVRAKHPEFGASRAAGCIVGSAGTGGVGTVTTRSPNLPWPGAIAPYSGTIPVVNAEAAVECASLTYSEGPGTGAPPSVLGGHPMTAFSPDDRPLYQLVSDVPDPAGTISFASPLSHHRVQDGWATWSHGYLGDVYFTGDGGEKEVEITVPTGTKAFSFYVEPNTFARFTAEAIADDGTSSEAVEIEGYAGARYFGFAGVAGRTVSSITVKASDPMGFAIGEFMISR